MSHTPGPWRVTHDDRVVSSPYSGENLATGGSYVAISVGSEADRALIAAAPDLLQALKLVWSMFDDGRILRNIANDGEPDWALKMLNFTRELQTIQKAIAKAEGQAEKKAEVR